MDQYVNHQMHLIKYNSGHVSNSYMFRHRSDIFRGSFRWKEYMSNTLL